MANDRPYCLPNDFLRSISIPIVKPKTASFVLAGILLFATGVRAQQLSPLESAPDWAKLEQFQETISRSDFERLLTTIYAPDGAWKDTITLGETSARIRTMTAASIYFELRFAQDQPKPAPRFWRSADELGPHPADRPLEGLHIALDPGHLGGKWARMEERWFRINDSKPVMEGEMTLRVAQKLAPRLEALGATVSFVRRTTNPVTKETARSLRDVARKELTRRGVSQIRETYSDPTDPTRSQTVQWESELLFYRASEIRARARVVNDELKPDLVLCLHFNAEPWGNPDRPDLVDKNHLHFLVNGCYSAAELAYDDIRFGMMEKLLNRTARESIELSDAVARAMAEATGLPPYEYPGKNAIHIGETGYVWARNLLANRLYLCPVVYAEPYVMNSRTVFERVQAGDYTGEREIDGVMRPSIFEEYTRGLVKGLVAYFRSHRATSSGNQ